MRYRSTRGSGPSRSFSEAVVEGAAPDGGLFIPEVWPSTIRFNDGAGHGEALIASLEAFGAIDVDEIVAQAIAEFHHPDVAPIVGVGPFLVMEMFWGPTLSFKDHALQVLARLIDRSLQEMGERRVVLVATSGDTGSASIAAFRGLASVDIVVLYPDGLVSDFQRMQMTTIPDENVTVVSVRGDFDDCQRMVKEAFKSSGFASANSINWGRIAAQVGYHISASARVGEAFDIVIPTGNFGNAFSAMIGRNLGSKVKQITVATNSNRVLADLQNTGQLSGGDAVATLAPAMDIQVPSNLERYLFDHTESEFSRDFGGGWVADEEILETIRRVFDTHGYLIDPHTAVAWAVAERSELSARPRLIVSTAHPAKFASTIETATGLVPEVPEWARIDSSVPERIESIGPDAEELLELIG